MLGKKLIVSAMATGLLWAAGLAGQAAVASRPGLLLLAGQLRVSLGDQEGGLRLMKQAAERDRASAPMTIPAAAPVSQADSVQCAPSARVRRVADSTAPPARVTMVSDRVLPPDFARQMAHRQHDLLRLALDQERLTGQMRVVVMQHVHGLDQPPAVPAEPLRANP